ncbi:unnamed protein product [Thlaspi arvense]|uniref:Uncharacterized protein n=1 Tax=Thlaspi arvense TaxID=13288 RepID=A0AAU9SPP6_THLAR|nr:unnamed protein product [Thlaspi arvense]
MLNLLFAVQFSNAEEPESPSEAPVIHKACDFRCSATSHKKPCLFYCNYCCKKCLCVPSGTYGHKEEYPCYNNWHTKEGGPKCP